MNWNCFSRQQSSPCPECAVRLREKPRVALGTVYPRYYTPIGVLATRPFCRVCTLVFESVKNWLDNRDPADEEMELMRTGYVGVSFHDLARLRPMKYIPGSLVVLVGAWDCSEMDFGTGSAWENEDFREKVRLPPDVKFILELYTTPQTGRAPCRAIRHGRHYATGIFDDRTLENVQRWLEYCGHRHRFCQQETEPLLPKRVIDVSGEQPHLHVSIDGEKGAYVCLSHRWGRPEAILKSEQATLQERRQGIPLSTLPPTFHDAVAFTRRLGYRYIWIDSLCIVQDDPNDWEQEAAKIGLYYENSALTLSVLQGNDPQAGCAWDAKDILTTSIKIGDCTIWCREIDSPAAHQQWMALEPGSSNDILFTRGWTLQESLLAPRLLLFTKRQVVWYCNSALHEFKNCDMAEPLMALMTKTVVSSLSQSEDIFTVRDMWIEIPRMLKDTVRLSTLGSKTSDYLPHMNIYTAVSQIYVQMLVQHCQRPLGTGPVRRHFASTMRGMNIVLWYKMVMEYAGRDLTYQSDKLVALSALARKFSTLVKEEYIAGLWMEKDFLRAQLGWELFWSKQGKAAVPCLGDCCRAKLKYDVPSWSWASVDGGVYLSPEWQQWYWCYSTIFNVLEGKCRTAGSDPFGRVSDGFLRVDARVGSFDQIGAAITCSKDKGRDRYEITWDSVTEAALKAAKSSIPTLFYGNSLSCSEPNSCGLGERLLLIPLATTDPNFIPKGTPMTMSARTVAKAHYRSLTHLSLLICIEVDSRDGSRTLRRVGACSMKVKGRLDDLGWVSKLEREELILV